MNLFRKKQSKTRTVGQANSRSMASRMEQSMRRLAALLGTQSEKLSINQKKITLIIFGLVLGGVCTGLIIRPFATDKAERFFIPAAIRSPVVKSLPSQEDSLIEQSSYRSLVRIRRIIDSLKDNTDGQGRYDQLMRQRPGLVDSLNILLNDYNESHYNY